jgi:hypothetical protein
MTIRCHGSDATVSIDASAVPGVLFARLTVEADDGMTSVSIDANHLEALETALRAARLELQARAVE